MMDDAFNLGTQQIIGFNNNGIGGMLDFNNGSSVLDSTDNENEEKKEISFANIHKQPGLPTEVKQDEQDGQVAAGVSQTPKIPTIQSVVVDGDYSGCAEAKTEIKKNKQRRSQRVRSELSDPPSPPARKRKKRQQ